MGSEDSLRVPVHCSVSMERCGQSVEGSKLGSEVCIQSVVSRNQTSEGWPQFAMAWR
jgi:hypothetical protein